jgi:hypothetical protein
VLAYVQKRPVEKRSDCFYYPAAQASASLFLPGPATLYAPALEQTKFLVDAAEVKRQSDTDWSDRFISILEQLRQRDLENYRHLIT